MTQACSEAATSGAAARSRKSSFYAAMRMLPRPRREAMYEIYSFCRAVDDIADDGGPRGPRLAALDAWRAEIAAICAGARLRTGLDGLRRATLAYGLRQEDFLAVIDGMEMDVREDLVAPDLATLDLYCDRVASAVGRLSVRVFGVPETEAEALAHHLGRAFQLTNILRDLDEDAGIGRLYLPREALESAGIAVTTPQEVLASPALARACAPVVWRARSHFEAGRDIMARCPRASVKAPRIMAEVYRSILAAVEARGFDPPRARIRTSRARVVLAALRYGLV
jgi:squalene synthase HpnD